MKRKLLLLNLLIAFNFAFAQPANDLCLNNQLLYVDGPCENGSTNGAGIEDPTIDPVYYPADVWYSFVATTDYSVVYVYPDFNVDPDIYMFDGCNGSVFAVGTAGLFAGEIDSVLINSVPGTTYYISVVGWQDAPYGNFCVEVLSRNEIVQPYDPCTDFEAISVGAGCLSDELTAEIPVKTYTFIASAPETFISLELDGFFYYPSIHVLEDNCSGMVVHDFQSTDFVLDENTYAISFPTQINQQYLFGVLHTDPSFSTNFPLDYCVRIHEFANIAEIGDEIVSIFPNPVQSKLNVDIGTNKGLIEIYNVLGNKIYYQEVFSSSLIDVSQLKSGMYLLKTNIDGKMYQSKFLKE